MCLYFHMNLSSGLSFLLNQMPTKCTCGREFAKFMTNHVFSNINWYMLTTIMHSNRVTDHLWEDSASATPRLNHYLFVIIIQRLNFFEKLRAYKRSLF